MDVRSGEVQCFFARGEVRVGGICAEDVEHYRGGGEGGRRWREGKVEDRAQVGFVLRDGTGFNGVMA